MAKKDSSKVERTPVTSENDNASFIKDLAQGVNTTLKRDAVMVGGDAAGGATGVPYWVTTGIPALDFAVGGFGHPGFPGSRIIEIYGAESTGKSTLAVWLTKCAMEQMECIAYYQDAERVLTPEIIHGTGIDMSQVLLEQPETIEEVFDAQETTLKLIKEKRPDTPVVITMDSVAACSTQSEIEGDMEDAQMAPHARLMSKGLRKIKGSITDTHVLSLWVNQTREKIGQAWGDKDETFGGRALKFYSSVRIKLTKIKTLKKTTTSDPYGCTIEAKIIKNKVAPPLKVATYDILFIEDETGSYPMLDTTGAILDWCKDNNLIGGGTGRYEVEGKSLYKEQAREVLLSDWDIYNKYLELAYSIKVPEDDEETEE